MNIIMEQTSSFRLVFGDSPVVKVLDFLLDNQEFDYSLTDIAREADVGYVTLHQFWKDLVALGIVKKTRNIGRATLYKLDAASPLVQKLLEIDVVVSRMAVQQKKVVVK